MGYDFELDGLTTLVHPVYNLVGDTFSIDDIPVHATLTPGLERGEYALDLDGRRERIFVATRADTHFIHWRGRAFRVEAINALDRAKRSAEPSGGSDILRAPMPGTVVDVATREGNLVDTGALLLTIESMKLQTAITAPHAGRVAEVYVSSGATFDQGDPLVRLEEPDVLATENGEESK